MPSIVRDVALTAACLLSVSQAIAAEPLVEDFDDKLALDWEIRNEDDSSYSLTEYSGELLLKTAGGHIHGPNSQEENGPKNLFLLKDPIPNDVDFTASIAVSQFEPTQNWHQVDLLLYQSHQSYVKACAEVLRERVNPDGSVTLTLFRESDGTPTKDVSHVVSVDGPLWLKLVRRDGKFSVEFSNDGDQYESHGSSPWQPDDPDAPTYIGFTAYNGPSNAKSIDVVLESFSFETDSPVSE